jgi:hypothetical protein
VSDAGRRQDAEDHGHGAEDRLREGGSEGGKSPLTWTVGLAERLEQIAWVLDHQEDIDADFLAIYGIDLLEQEVSGPRYFALAYRLAAYQGVLAARVDEERDQTSSTTTRTHDAPPPRQGSSENREVSLTAFRVMFPGIVSGGSAGGGIVQDR